MNISPKKLYVIAGCNGAGKTTVSFAVLPELLTCKEYVNADEIARGISPFQPEKVAIEAGKVMLHRIDELLATGEDFAFETTLASRSFTKTLEEAKSNGYFITLLFFWLENEQLAIQRVKSRVSEGGHNIAEETIKRRYHSGIKNLFQLYFEIPDLLLIYDNSKGLPELIIHKKKGFDELILNSEKFRQLKSLS